MNLLKYSEKVAIQFLVNYQLMPWFVAHETYFHTLEDANSEKHFRKDGYTIFSEPRKTGDGYYESVILDPEGNYLEVSA